MGGGRDMGGTVPTLRCPSSVGLGTQELLFFSFTLRKGTKAPQRGEPRMGGRGDGGVGKGDVGKWGH